MKKCKEKSMLQKRITRQDIAKMAGTSVSVVSRALNNSGYVAEEKKMRILKIAEEYEYNPNPLALTLQKQRMKQVLFYCKDIKNTYNIQMYQGMTKCAVPRGYKVFINGIMEYSDIRNILIDGIIMPNQGLAHRYFEETGKNYCIPVVCASYGDDVYLQKAVPMVEVDMYKVMESALDYLYGMGHKIISLAMPYPYEDSSARTKSYISWCRKHGINNPEEYFIGVSDRYLVYADDFGIHKYQKESENVIEGPEDFFGKGIHAASDFLERNIAATAVIGFNDEFSLGMMKGFSTHGIRVPQDISIMGIDGNEIRRYREPLLSTMDVFPEKQGEKCMEVLLDMIEGKTYKYRNYTSFSLSEGDSVLKINT